jgi:hypothetical protein
MPPVILIKMYALLVLHNGYQSSRRASELCGVMFWYDVSQE